MSLNAATEKMRGKDERVGGKQESEETLPAN